MLKGIVHPNAFYYFASFQEISTVLLEHETDVFHVVILLYSLYLYLPPLTGSTITRGSSVSILQATALWVNRLRRLTRSPSLITSAPTKRTRTTSSLPTPASPRCPSGWHPSSVAGWTSSLLKGTPRRGCCSPLISASPACSSMAASAPCLSSPAGLSLLHMLCLLLFVPVLCLTSSRVLIHFLTALY